MAMSTGIVWIVVLGVMVAAIFYLLLTPLRVIRREQREILSTGQAAVGTIVALMRSRRVKVRRSTGSLWNLLRRPFESLCEFNFNLARVKSTSTSRCQYTIAIKFRSWRPLINS